MNIFFCHNTALEYWRKYRQGIFTNMQEVRTKPPTTPPDTRALRADTPWGLSKPLHIMVASPNARKVSREITSHFCRGPFTRGCFVKTAEGYFVSSPEFCFFQMASVLSLEGLIKLAYELCGSYVLVPASDKGYENCKPLTTVAKLTAFANRMSGLHGRKKALRALRYALNDAASPRETLLAIILTLPYRLGGFGFSKPQLNAVIDPNRFARSTADKQYYSCDLYWHKSRLAVEYESNAFHTGADRIAADSIRRNTLILMGIEVFTVTNKQLQSITETKKVAVLLSKHLGKALRYKEPVFTQRNLVLRRRLMD